MAGGGFQNRAIDGDLIIAGTTITGALIVGGSITGASIDIGGADATSFHVDVSGQLWLGAADYATAPFKVSAGGDLVASSVILTGPDINDGSIAGGTLDIGGADTSSFHVDVSGNIWSGHADYASAPFKVSAGGDLVASSVTLTGPDINGPAIVGGTLDIGGADTSSFHVDVSGNIWSGAATYAAAPFKVSAAGALVASSATITGNLSTGTGSGNYWTSDTDTIKFYNGGTWRGQIQYASSRLTFGGTGAPTSLSDITPALTLNDANARISVNGGGTTGKTYIGSIEGNAESDNVYIGWYSTAVPTIRIFAGSSANSTGTDGYFCASAKQGIRLSAEAASVGVRLYVANAEMFKVLNNSGAAGLYAPLPALAGNTGQFNTTSKQIGYLSSSRRHKRNISKVNARPLAGLNFMALRAVSFDWAPDIAERSGLADSPSALSLIAEEAADVDPRLATWQTDPETGDRIPAGLNEHALLAAIISEVQDQRLEFLALESRVDSLAGLG